MPKPFSWPVKTHWLSQGWGVYRPEIYSQFGFTRHNGWDHIFGANKHIHAPCDGYIILNDNQPNGGGIYMSLLSDPIDFPFFTCTTPDGKIIPFKALKCPVRIDFLHLEKSLVATGTRVSKGDLIAIGDNTGFSTGPHLHTQWRRVHPDPSNTHADINEANNSFDPSQFMDGFHAQDTREVQQKMKDLILILKSVVELLTGKNK